MNLYLSITFLLFSCFSLFGQTDNVGIGTNSPDPSSQLELKSNTQGLLVPRLTSDQRIAINNPAPGLLVFDTDIRTLFLFDGNQWFPLAIVTDNADFPPTERTIDAAASLGYRVDISDLGIVSSTQDGRVFFFNYDGGNYTNMEEIISSSSNPISEKFGQDVAIDGNYLAIGAPGGNVDTGKVYIFERVGGVWTEQEILKNGTNPILGDGFGWSVSMSGNGLVAGAPLDDIFGNINEGSFTFYQRSSGSYTQSIKVFQPGGSGFMPGDFFAWDVDIDGIYIIVGAPGFSNREGKAYYYRVTGTTLTLDHQEEYSFDVEPNTFYGYSVAIDSSLAIVGFPGINTNAGGYHIIGNFGNPIYGDEGLEFQQFRNSGPFGFPNVNSFLGASVSVDGDFYTVGAPHQIDPIFSANQNNFENAKVDIYSHRKGSGALFTSLIDTWLAKDQSINGMGISTAIMGLTPVVGNVGENRFYTKTFLSN